MWRNNIDPLLSTWFFWLHFNSIQWVMMTMTITTKQRLTKISDHWNVDNAQLIRNNFDTPTLCLSVKEIKQTNSTWLYQEYKQWLLFLYEVFEQSSCSLVKCWRFEWMHVELFAKALAIADNTEDMRQKSVHTARTSYTLHAVNMFQGFDFIVSRLVMNDNDDNDGKQEIQFISQTNV